MAAAVWGMDNFNEYLKGSRFTLYMDPTPAPELGNTQMKTWNWLQTAMSKHNFDTKNCQTSNIPLQLKHRQHNLGKLKEIDNQNFNKVVHINTFQSINHDNHVITAITDESTEYSIATISDITRPDFLIQDLQNKWFMRFGIPDTLFLKQGKVPISKLKQKINQMAPLTKTITCRIRSNTFNTDTEQQWQQTRHQLHEEEFTNAMNLFYNLQNPQLGEESEVTNSGYHLITEDYTETGGTSEGKDGPEYDLDELLHFSDNRTTCQPKRKNLSLCRHKLQGRTGC
jgi:hypothetical protein